VGLKSLSQINRSGVFNFWESIWESRYSYNSILFSNKILQNIFYEFFTLFFFKYVFKKNKDSGGYLNHFNLVIGLHPLIYFSKIWVLRYQGWFIIVVYYFNLKFTFKKKTKSLLSSYQYNSFFKIRMNYNYKF